MCYDKKQKFTGPGGEVTVGIIDTLQRENAGRKTGNLSNDSIRSLCDEAEAFLTANGVAKKEMLKVTLTLEEALLNYREHLPEDSVVTLRAFAVLGTIRATVTVEGERCDPFALEDLSAQSIMGALMAGEDAAHASWKYKETYNEIVFMARRERKLSSIARIALGFLCGAALGAVMLLLPEETAKAAVSSCITPVTGAFTGLLCVMAAPMCFFAVTLGIVRMGDLSSVGNVAKKLVGRLALTALLVSLLGALGTSSQMFFGGRELQIFGIRKLFEILIGFVPTNILSPMLNFNSVQIIVVGVMFGASLLAMGQKGDNLVELFDSLNTVAVTCNAVYLNRFIPYYVALTVLGIVGSRQIAVAPGFLRLSLDILAGELVIMAFSAAAVFIRLRIPLRVFSRKMAPPFMIALSSASFGAAFVENVNTLFALGVEPSYASLGYNVGGIIFRPGECVIFTASSLHMAYLFGVEVTPMWMVTAFALAFILSVATPPVPGGTAVSLAILFSQLGFSEEALTLIIPLSMMLEFPTVAIDAFCAKCQVLLMAASAGKVDIEKAMTA